MQPFEISFSTELISDLRRGIERTRCPELRFDVGWERGTDDATLRELAAYWLDGYDFEAIQERLNRLTHLRGPIEGEQLHCVVYGGSGDRRLALASSGFDGRDQTRRQASWSLSIRRKATPDRQGLANR